MGAAGGRPDESPVHDVELAPFALGRTPVTRAVDVERRIQTTPAGQPVLLKVKRGGRSRYIAIERR